MDVWGSRVFLYACLLTTSIATQSCKRMVEGYDSADANQGIPPELDDYICDYVDGSMDPSVCAVFEEFLEANPEVHAHVCRVAQTAALLRSHSRCLCAPDGFDSRLKCAVENESLAGRSGNVLDAMNRLGGMVLFSSSVAVVCLGMIVFVYGLNEPDYADTMGVESFSEVAEPLEGFTSAVPWSRSGESAPDRRSLQLNTWAPQTSSFMRQMVLEDAPVPVFSSVRTSRVSVLYP